jgi:hypothetical protein
VDLRGGRHDPTKYISSDSPQSFPSRSPVVPAAFLNIPPLLSFTDSYHIKVSLLQLQIFHIQRVTMSNLPSKNLMTISSPSSIRTTITSQFNIFSHPRHISPPPLYYSGYFPHTPPLNCYPAPGTMCFPKQIQEGDS